MAQVKDSSVPDESPAHAVADEPGPVSAVGLVQLHDGSYGLVVSVDPPKLVRLGRAERHELPVSAV